MKKEDVEIGRWYSFSYGGGDVAYIKVLDYDDRSGIWEWMVYNMDSGRHTRVSDDLFSYGNLVDDVGVMKGKLLDLGMVK